MTPDYHHIAFVGLDVANPVTMPAIEAMAARADLLSTASVLDIGAGTGGVSVALARRFGFHVSAIERDPAMVAHIRSRVAEQGLSGRVDAVAEHSTEALDRLSPADMIVALGSTEAAGKGVREPGGIFRGLAGRLKNPGYLLWGDLVWTADAPAPLRQVIGLSGIYATDEGWKVAGRAAGLECVASEMSPQGVWNDFFDGTDARVRDWMAANPTSPGIEKLKLRADQIKATFDFGRPYLGFGLYLFRKE